MKKASYISISLFCLLCFCNGKEFPKLGYVARDNTRIYQGIPGSNIKHTYLGILYKDYPIVVDKETTINGVNWYRVQEIPVAGDDYGRWVKKDDLIFDKNKSKLFGVYFLYKKKPVGREKHYNDGRPDYSIYIYTENELILHKLTSNLLSPEKSKKGRWVDEMTFLHKYGTYNLLENKLTVQFYESNEVETSEFQILSIPVRGGKKDIFDQLECEVRDNKISTCYLNGAEQHIIKKIYLTLGL
ncbi:MAG: hypothetical protein MH321_18660 [Leptospiraceae bacterium]|nr:hypothetical protein [Leptospiraceae bacterium]